jgi:hypothetical protein
VDSLKKQVASCLSTLQHIDNSVRDLVDAQTDARAAEDEQYKRLGWRVQVLTLVIAAAAVITPLAVTYLHGH